jgi:hypothetical protein
MSPAAQRLFSLADGTGSRNCGLVKVSAELLQLTEKPLDPPAAIQCRAKGDGEKPKAGQSPFLWLTDYLVDQTKHATNSATRCSAI